MQLKWVSWHHPAFLHLNHQVIFCWSCLWPRVQGRSLSIPEMSVSISMTVKRGGGHSVLMVYLTFGPFVVSNYFKMLNKFKFNCLLIGDDCAKLNRSDPKGRGGRGGYLILSANFFIFHTCCSIHYLPVPATVYWDDDTIWSVLQCCPLLFSPDPVFEYNSANIECYNDTCLH